MTPDRAREIEGMEVRHVPTGTLVYILSVDHGSVDIRTSNPDKYGCYPETTVPARQLKELN